MTIDGHSHPLPQRFMVVATQNPIEQQGTYPLPEAQLDRFMFKQLLDLSGRDGGARHRRRPRPTGRLARSGGHGGRGMVGAAAPIEAAATAVSQVRLTDEVVGYVVDLVRATRASADLELGASPRSGAMLAAAARARAVLQGRDYVIPDDVKALALPALRHRVILSPAAEIEGRRADDAIVELIETVSAPR